MTSRTFSFVKILLLVQFLVLLSALAQEEKSFVIGVESFPYFPHSEVKDGKYRGFGREVLDLFAKVKGYKFKYVSDTYDKVSRDFIHESVDFQYPDNSYWSSEIKKGIDIVYSNPVVRSTDALHLLYKNKDKTIDEIRIIGTLVGFTPIQYYPLVKKKKIEIVYASKIEKLISLVKNEKIDGVYLNVDVIAHRERGSKSPLVFAEKLPHKKSYYSLSTIKHRSVVNEFNQFLKTHEDDIASLKRKYKLLD